MWISISYSYRSIVSVLADLHKIDYKSIGLASYGKSSNFYPRQIATLAHISKLQAATKDTHGNTVGELPRLNDMITWFEKNQVKDEATIAHGDFKVLRLFLFGFYLFYEILSSFHFRH